MIASILKSISPIYQFLNERILFKDLNSWNNNIETGNTLLFRDFLEALVRVSRIKYTEEKTLFDSLQQLLTKNLLRNSFKNRLYFKKRIKDQFIRKLHDNHPLRSLIDEIPIDLPANKPIWLLLEQNKQVLTPLYNSFSEKYQAMTLRGLLTLFKVI